MQKRNLFAIFALAIMVTAFSGFGNAAFAAQSATSSSEVKSIGGQSDAQQASVKPLDEDSLKKNIISRLANLTKSKNFIDFSKENISLAAKTSVVIGDSTYWVVRLGVKNLPQVEKNDAKNISMDVVVDPSGTYQFFDIQHVAHQGSLFAEAKREMGRIKHPVGFGSLMYAGKGTAEVLFISDPFCSYCREEFKLLTKYKDSAKSITIAHFPQMAATSLITASFLVYAKENFSEEKFHEVLNFVYGTMTPQSSDLSESLQKGAQHPVTALERDAIAVLVKKFPESLNKLDEENFYYMLKGKYATLIEEQKSKLKELLSVSGTPVTVIDGAVIRGFNEPEIKLLLNIKE